MYRPYWLPSLPSNLGLDVATCACLLVLIFVRCCIPIGMTFGMSQVMLPVLVVAVGMNVRVRLSISIRISARGFIHRSNTAGRV